MRFGAGVTDVEADHQALPGSANTDVPAAPVKIGPTDPLRNQHEVSLLAKVTDANMVKNFRPIAVLPVIYKLYSRVMYMLTETTCRHLVSAQFAFRKYHQAHEVVFIFRQRVEKRWTGRRHIYTSWTGTSGRPTITCPMRLSRRPQNREACTRFSSTRGCGSGEE